MDKLDAIRTFIKVQETGSFSATAEALRVSQSSVSKKVQWLEQSLSFQLLHRTSRSLNLTDQGKQYFDFWLTKLAEIDEAESHITQHQAQVSGLLRVSVPVTLGHQLLTPELPGFLARYPDVQLEMSLNDQYVDLHRDDFDVVIRGGKLQDSMLKGRLLMTNEAGYFASSRYLDKYGEPLQPEDLSAHKCLYYSLSRQASRWSFQNAAASDKSSIQHQAIQPSFISNNADVLLNMMLADQGITLLPKWMVLPEYEDQVQVLFKDYQPAQWPVYALYKNTAFVPAKIRCFVDFLCELFDPDRLSLK
jgi:DNA-binding transcriptional LysR family regulator